MKPESSLLSRFAASTAALAIVVAGLALLFSVVINSKLVHDAMEGTVRGYSLSLTKEILAKQDPDFWRQIASTHQVAIFVDLPENRVAYGPSGEATTQWAIFESFHGLMLVEVPVDNGGRVVFSWNLNHFSRLHWPLIAGHIALLFPVIGATYWFQRSQLRPLQSLRSGVDSVAAGDFETRVPVVRRDEIGRVAGAFNQMTRQVEKMIADRERLLADVSHELRSPLARVKVALELLPEGEKQRLIQADVREMESLISVLLEREQLRAKTDNLAVAPVDLVSLVRKVTERFEGRAPGVQFLPPVAALTACVDADLVRLLVLNLIENAVKFSLADSRPVEVELLEAGNGVRLLICDDGPGIAAADVEEVFKPFVKLNPARGHQVGYGLGLNLCWRIVEAHGGTIRMRPNGERGNCVVVELPHRVPK